MNAATRAAPPASIHRSSGIRPIVSVRAQAAFVRTLLDELERATTVDMNESLEGQLVEELARLGCGCIELAAMLSDVVEEQARARAGARVAIEAVRVA